MKVLLGCIVVLGVAWSSAAKVHVPRDCWRGGDMDNVSLVWAPTDEIAAPKVVTLAPGAAAPAPWLRVEIRALSDARENKHRIGENRERVEKDGCIYPVTTKEDAAAWTTDRFRSLLGRLGYPVVDTGGDVVISGELRRFFVSEGGTYDGTIDLKLDVASKDGKPLWSGLVRGTNGHWGKSYKLANYHETLSDALIDAIEHLSANPDFARAVTPQP